MKHHRYIKLSKQGMLDGKRRYVPLEWVRSVRGNIVHLGQTTTAVRQGWLSGPEFRADVKAAAKAARAETSDS